MIKAKKSLGQNFLVDKNIIETITNIIDIENKTVLEVGPGTGNLTSSLLNKNPKKIYVVEKDIDLALMLQQNFGKKLNIINDDILKLNENNICDDQLIEIGRASCRERV